MGSLQKGSQWGSQEEPSSPRPVAAAWWKRDEQIARGLCESCHMVGKGMLRVPEMPWDWGE